MASGEEANPGTPPLDARKRKDIEQVGTARPKCRRVSWKDQEEEGKSDCSHSNSHVRIASLVVLFPATQPIIGISGIRRSHPALRTWRRRNRAVPPMLSGARRPRLSLPACGRASRLHRMFSRGLRQSRVPHQITPTASKCLWRTCTTPRRCSE